MKRFISGFIVGALIFSMLGAFAAVTYVAKPVDFKVMVNGKEFVSDPPALEVDGRTYLPLRAMGEALNVPVNWNEELRQAEVCNSGTINGVNKIKGDAVVEGITFNQLSISDIGEGYIRCDVNVTNTSEKDLDNLIFKIIFYDDAGNRVFISGLGSIATRFKRGETKTVTMPTFVSADLSKATNVKYEFLFDIN